MRVSVVWAFARALLVLAMSVRVVHAEEARAPVEVRILAINDFHGNLMPPPGGIQIPDPEKLRCRRAAPNTWRRSSRNCARVAATPSSSRPAT
jgi:2',3'-cyclic-nucleotide 2'-phosphodiesterase (5'-nucleotidase family)